MRDTVRPRRSVLYVPGSNVRALSKAVTLDADVLILDLEDAVTPDAKVEARRNVAAALAGWPRSHHELVVRINSPGGPWGSQDLAMAAVSGAHAVLLPKVEESTSVAALDASLHQFGAPAELRIWCMIETPLGVLRVSEIASASSRLDALVMGTSDLVQMLQARHTANRLPVLVSIAHCLLAARAYGLSMLDGVHLDLADTDGLALACTQARDMGLDGKTLIHPATIAAANSAFAPGPDEVEMAGRVIDAYRRAEMEGAGVTTLDGKLVEALHVRDAERLLALDAGVRRRRLATNAQQPTPPPPLQSDAATYAAP